MNDSRDEPNDSENSNGLIGRWKAWRAYRRLIAEERREIRSLERSRQETLPESAARNRGADQPATSDRNRPEPSDSDSVVSRSAVRSEMNLDADQATSFWSQWRKSAELRRQIREEKKSIDKELGSDRFVPNTQVVQSDEELSVGGTRQSVQDGGDEGRPSLRIRLAMLSQEVLRLRIPQWAIATIPAVAMTFFCVVPAVSDLESRSAAHVRMLSSEWPRMIEAGRWNEAEMCGLRILSADMFGLDDNFRFFECLSHSQDPNRGWRFLAAREASLRERELASYRLRFAEAISKLPKLAADRKLQNLMVSKTRESLAGPLSEQEEIKARQFLTNLAVAQGNYDAAMSLLEPIASRSPFLAADLLFLKYNRAGEADLTSIKSAAASLLVTIDAQMRNAVAADDTKIRTNLRLLMMLDRESEAREWLATLTGLNDSQKKAVTEELDKLSLLAEVKKVPVRTTVAWKRLLPLIESDPNNRSLTRIAFGLWTKADKDSREEIDRWVRQKLSSEDTDLTFFREACMATHLSARWDDARFAYRKLLERVPDDVSALNNLSGLLYKFPPREMDESLRLVDRAIRLAPENLVVLDTKGQILARMGRFDEARQILEKCLPVLPREWNLHNTLAQIFERTGEDKKAVAHRSALANIAKPADADVYGDLADYLPQSNSVK
jgi:tetratricopeptide (TPR) repeat protein